MPPNDDPAGVAAAAAAASGDDRRTLRMDVPYERRYQRFILKNKEFMQQFSHVYNRRLVQLHAAVRAAAAQRWGAGGGGDGVPVVERIVQMREGERWVAVGTLFKAMRLKPCVLDEYKAERGLSHATVIPYGDFTSDDDALVLEDQSGRIALISAEPTPSLCTGVVIAVCGVVQPSGDFLVEDWCPAGIPPQPAMAPATAGGAGGVDGGDPLVLLASGLQAGGVQDPLPMRMLMDFVAGYIGSADEVSLAARIARVVVCGENVAPPNAEAAALLAGRGDGTGAAARHLSPAQQRIVAAPSAELDTELAQLSAAAPTDVMPGIGDPSNYTLPQQPFHPCLLPLSSRLSTFNAVTNPYEAVIGSRIFLGTSGQPLADIMNGKSAADAAADEPWCLQLLEDMLHWRHLCPTAPDTLGCYPFVDDDPFVVEECPHVFFAGNQPCFATKAVRGAEGPQV
ncbi:unnamed protein product, partial [Phaeothamnion confervicola]